MLRSIQFIVGIVLFIVLEVVRAYFATSQQGNEEENTLAFANFIHENIFYFRTIALLIIVVPAVQVFLLGTIKTKIFVGVCLVIALTVFLLCNNYY